MKIAIIGFFVRGTILASFTLVGCSTPSATYEIAKDDDYNLREGRVVFALRTTDITLIPSPMKQPDPCSGTTDAVQWAKCLDALLVQVTPSPDPTVYVAKPADSSMFAHTKFAATSLNDDPPNIDTVTIAFSDDTSQFISGVGTGATEGFAFGPGGAVAGGILAGIGGIITGRGIYANWTPQSSNGNWQGQVCDEGLPVSKAQYLASAEALKLAVSLPYVITLANATQDSNTSCWHALPVSPSAVRTLDEGQSFAWSGWVYRLILGDPPKGAMKRDDPLISTYFDGKTVRHTFPYSPCQRAELQLTWWSELKAASSGASKGSYRSYSIKVANPSYLRFASLPKGGTIKLGTVCNAQLTFGSYSGSTSKADVDATLKAVSDFKAAQAKAKASAGK